MKRIILFGSNGMLGTYLNAYLSPNHEVIALTRKDIDLAVASELELMELLRGIVTSDDVIINASGVIKQREYNVADMIKVNSVFPHILAKFKDEVGCEVIHITTDCVFSGREGGYYETFDHDCTDDYGKSKSLGEPESITNIRTSIIGEEKTNKKSLLEWVRSNAGKTIDGYTNHYWNGVTCLELAKQIDEILNAGSYWVGVRHMYSPDTHLSKYQLVNMINDVYELGITIKSTKPPIACFRNLLSTHHQNVVKPLVQQIREMKEYKI